MKKFLAIALLMSSAVPLYGITYQESLAQAAAAAAAPAVVTVDLSKVNPAYQDSVRQLKEAVPVIIKSAKTLVPKITSLVEQTASGGLMGLVQGTIQVAADSNTRNAIIDLTKVTIATIKTTIKLADADPSTKKTVKDLLSAVSRDPDVVKLISLSKKVPIVGEELHNKLQELINDIVSYK